MVSWRLRHASTDDRVREFAPRLMYRGAPRRTSRNSPTDWGRSSSRRARHLRRGTVLRRVRPVLLTCTSSGAYFLGDEKYAALDELFAGHAGERRTTTPESRAPTVDAAPARQRAWPVGPAPDRRPSGASPLRPFFRPVQAPPASASRPSCPASLLDPERHRSAPPSPCPKPNASITGTPSSVCSRSGEQRRQVRDRRTPPRSRAAPRPPSSNHPARVEAGQIAVEPVRLLAHVPSRHSRSPPRMPDRRANGVPVGHRREQREAPARAVTPRAVPGHQTRPLGRGDRPHGSARRGPWAPSTGVLEEVERAGHRAVQVASPRRRANARAGRVGVAAPTKTFGARRAHRVPVEQVDHPLGARSRRGRRSPRRSSGSHQAALEVGGPGTASVPAR